MTKMMRGIEAEDELVRGRYRARRTCAANDIAAAQALRYRAFFDAGGSGRDHDRFDATCEHFLVEPARGGAPVACFRMMPLVSGAEIGRSYSAQFYDLTRLAGFRAPMAELGRFCVAPGVMDPDILRLAWAAITARVDLLGIEMLFGCSSFPGTDGRAFRAGFSLLGARHLAPRRWRPGVKARDIVRFSPRPGTARALPDSRAALASLPALLRSYLAMGGWVSDHAVVDREMGTLHVFTGLELGAVPAGRARALRALAG